MAYKKGEDRRQVILFPDCIDDYVEQDAPARLFDVFVGQLEMGGLGFIRSTPRETGAPGYDPRDLLKLYIYGYFYQVRSSRRLARECRCNIEVMWLLGKLTPDFRTISDFRKDNRVAIAKVYKEFNRFCMRLRLLSKSYISIDGSKFKAVNAKDNNFTMSKLDDRIKRLDEHIALYMDELDSRDDEEERTISEGETRRKLEACERRKERYEGYRDQLESSGESQLSLTDPDSRLMKANEGFCVGYNVQTAVDAGSHMIAGYQVTNSATDHGLLTGVASEVKADYGVGTLEATADKGYESPRDHAEALAGGIVPNVIRRDGGDTEVVSFNYKESDITGGRKASVREEDLRACLEAGVIPDVYEGILTDATVTEVRGGRLSSVDSAVASMTEGEMRAKALEGFFVRDAGRNLVYCPQGETLRVKSVKSNGRVYYCNKLACGRCKCRCTAQKFKEADFSKDQLIKASGFKGQSLPKGDVGGRAKPPTAVRRVAQYVLHLDRRKMEDRKCLSEHPFGTIKRALGQYYFLLKGFEKVSAEMGLFCLSYNIRRAITLKGVPALIAALG